ncbi:hypothetical protein ACIPJ2_02335 [Curtobacterium sp. NPDC090217]|uniref:hypothetical protein n=1 Tax=Curtobacterium sp. NPDC090217 TaxID=3363970 RepID=UPI0037F43987
MRKHGRFRVATVGIAAIIALGIGTNAPAYADDTTTPDSAATATPDTGDMSVDAAFPGDPSAEADTPSEWLEQKYGSTVTGPDEVQVPVEDDDSLPSCGDDESTICMTATVTDDLADATPPAPPSPAPDTARSLSSLSAGTSASAADEPSAPLISSGCLSSPISRNWEVARWTACSHRKAVLDLITKEGERVGRVKYETFHEVTGNPTKGE